MAGPEEGEGGISLGSRVQGSGFGKDLSQMRTHVSPAVKITLSS